MTDYKYLQKKGYGPGGIVCPCCNRWNCSPRKSKPLDRRFIRRKLKQKLQNEQQ